jgi:hypothetical protein
MTRTSLLGCQLMVMDRATDEANVAPHTQAMFDNATCMFAGRARLQSEIDPLTLRGITLRAAADGAQRARKIFFVQLEQDGRIDMRETTA